MRLLDWLRPHPDDSAPGFGFDPDGTDPEDFVGYELDPDIEIIPQGEEPYPNEIGGTFEQDVVS